jgi:uncharacterized membrane protein YphA (DoxX/SURF4 family)
MHRLVKLSIFALRIAVGWYFLYMGIVSFLDPAWSILPDIKNAHTFSQFYLGVAQFAPYVSYLFKGLFVLIGVLLIIGMFVRVASFLGIVTVLFFYFPLLHFPYVGTSYYIVDDHIVIAIALVFLFASNAGKFLGVGSVSRLFK